MANWQLDREYSQAVEQRLATPCSLAKAYWQKMATETDRNGRDESWGHLK